MNVVIKNSMFTGVMCVALMSAGHAQADEWERRVGLTGYMFGMKGEAGAKGLSADVDLSIQDVVSNLDGALTLYTDGTNGSWGYWGSFEYIRIEDDAAKVGNLVAIGPGTKIKGDFQTETTILDGGFSYNINESVELIGGLRYWRLDNEITAAISIGDNLGRAKDVSGSESVLDGFIGTRVKLQLSENWSSMLRFDLGAGDSDSTYQAMAMMNYHINDNWTTSFGYRYLSLDYENNGFIFDMENQGIQIAVLYTF